jgi:anti-anti-sigma factor
VSLTVSITRLSDGVVEVAPRGEIDVDCAHEVRDAVAEAINRWRPRRIELNLHGVAFIDSTAISAMVAGFQAAQVSGAKLVVTRPSRFVHRTLWVTGLLGLFGGPEPDDGDAETAPQPSASAT